MNYSEKMKVKMEKLVLLRVNLSNRSISEEEISDIDLKENIGGKGLATKYLLDEIPAKINPLHEQNKLIFIAGPLTATIFPTANRYGILYKSPLTGTFAESYSGGGVAQKLRASGYFMIIIEGKALQPTILHISESDIKFENGLNLWGKDTYETFKILKEKEDSYCDILCIGPAGENLVKIANIQNNLYHSAGRCGPGAVMGSKNLKAIIFSGNKRPILNKDPKFRDLVQDMLKKLRDKPELYGNTGLYRQYGTPSIVDWANEIGCFPTRYFTEGYSNFATNFNANAINSKILKKRQGCWNCPFTCGKLVEVKDGAYKCTIEGPEYETIAVFGGICDIREIEAIAKINEYCDRMGIDTISAGNLCGLAIEAKKRNLIPLNIPLDIEYNAPLKILDFLSQITYQNGLGKDFSEGTRYVAKKYNLEKFAMHVKGLEFAGYDPRQFRGFALSYGVSPEGPTHLRSVYHSIEHILPNRLEYSNKVIPMIEEEDRMAIIDSLIVCKFIRNVLDWETLTRIYNTIFNTSINTKKLREIANIMVKRSRIFNIREGFERKDDYLPSRVYEEEISAPNGTKNKLDFIKYDEMLDKYYSLRGWDENGNP